MIADIAYQVTNPYYYSYPRLNNVETHRFIFLRKITFMANFSFGRKTTDVLDPNKISITWWNWNGTENRARIRTRDEFIVFDGRLGWCLLAAGTKRCKWINQLNPKCVECMNNLFNWLAMKWLDCLLPIMYEVTSHLSIIQKSNVHAHTRMRSMHTYTPAGLNVIVGNVRRQFYREMCQKIKIYWLR